MSERIRRLGARCDLDSDDGEGGLSFSVTEFAELEGGRRVDLDHRGWSSWLRSYGGEPGAEESEILDPWVHVTRESLEDHVRFVVLPDDDETAAVAEHDWEHLTRCAAEAGIETTAQELSDLDYLIELSDDLLARVERRGATS